MSKEGRQNFQEVVANHPDVSRFVILKTDTGLRGVTLTDRALERARESNALFEEVVEESGVQVKQQILGGAVLRDGSAVQGMDGVLVFRTAMMRNGLPYAPYIMDVVDGKLLLLDGREAVEECDFVPIPEYYGKKTSRGTPMCQVAREGPADCLNISPYNYCYFWEQKHPCKYCSWGAQPRSGNRNKTPAELEDIYETVSEALKEPGRWTGIRLIAGSDPTGLAPYENEANQYIAALQTLGRCFGSKQLPVRLVASAFPEQQLVRLAEAGATATEPHLEVWDEKLFQWICPGKAKYFGRQYWIESAIAAVKVFGKGNVCSQFVAGAEMAQPYGFKTIDEAVASTLEGAEFFAKHGVTTSANLLRVGRGSIFHREKQAQPTLEYCVRIASGLRDIRRRYRLGADFNDYRRCAIHPDTDLSRLDYPEVEAPLPGLVTSAAVAIPAA